MTRMNKDFSTRLLSHITSVGRLGKAERHLFSTKSAKHVRPMFLFSCGELLGVKRDYLIDFACAVELIHTATLIHDDIIDEASERRSLPSVNREFDNKTAVLAGDGLLATALSLLATGPRPAETVRVAASKVTMMAESVSKEFEPSGNLTQDQLLDIVDGKTGALFSLCGYLAGIAADNDEAAAQLGRVGTLVGRVFQIRDDIDDIDEDKRNTVSTLPITLGIETSRSYINEAYLAIDDLLAEYKNNTKFDAFYDTMRQVTRAE